MDLDIDTNSGKINAMRTLGVPYEKGYESSQSELAAQATMISSKPEGDSIKVSPKRSDSTDCLYTAFGCGY